MRRNVSGQYVGAQMITAADGTAFTGTVSVLVTVDNGTQTAGGGSAPAHEGNGYHSYGPTQAETNGSHVAFTFTGAGAIPVTVQIYPVSYDANGRFDVGALGGDAQSLTDLKDFADAGYDPATNKVQGVVLTDTVTTYTGNTPQTGDAFARLGAPAGASVSADIAAAKADTASILLDTGTDGVVVAAGSKTGYSLSATQTFDLTGNITGNLSGSVGSLTTNNDKTGYALSATGSAALTEGYASLGAAATLPQILYEIRALLAEKSISSTTLTTKKLDGSTTAATYTLDDATTPSAITRAT